SKKELNMRQCCCIELFSDYDCKTRYHPGKANVVADALRLEKGLDEMIELRNDRALCYLDQIWVLLKGDVRTLIMNKARKSKYYVYPGADKMYYDLRDRYWWPGIKKDLAVYGKENRVNIFKSIDEGPFQMGTFQEILFEGNEDALHLGRQIRVQVNNTRGAGAAGYERAQNREYFKDKMLLMQAQENSVALDEENLLFIVGGQDNNASTAQTMFMANLSIADHVYDEAGLSYDSDILSEVHDHDHYQDVVCEHHKVHEMHEDVQRNYVVDSHADYTSDSNMISYNQYVKDNTVPVVQNESKSSQRADLNFKTNESIDGVPSQYACNACPQGITKGERGFEQTKECYLTEVIPFFKTIKSHFEGIQKALTKEIKEIEENFEELEAEVDQHVVNRKHAEIERKNLLIANDNLIADCLSKDVFYTATDSVLTVFKFSDIHEAFNVAQKRIVELESKISNLKNKIQNDVMVKHFSKLEVEHLNLQLKYQHLKECFENKKSLTSSDAPIFDSVFVIGQLKDQVQSRGNMIHELREKSLD
nr:hypothetical protein [Tanacetum cinerariifolium]